MQILLNGLKWKVGKGARIRVSDDAWLPSNNATLVPSPNLNRETNLMISDLINFDEGC